MVFHPSIDSFCFFPLDGSIHVRLIQLTFLAESKAQALVARVILIEF